MRPNLIAGKISGGTLPRANFVAASTNNSVHASNKKLQMLLWHLMDLQLLLGELSSNSLPSDHHRHQRVWVGPDSRSFQRFTNWTWPSVLVRNNFHVLSLPGATAFPFQCWALDKFVSPIARET